MNIPQNCIKNTLMKKTRLAILQFLRYINDKFYNFFAANFLNEKYKKN